VDGCGLSGLSCLRTQVVVHAGRGEVFTLVGPRTVEEVRLSADHYGSGPRLLYG
jgi:hypothetical protein